MELIYALQNKIGYGSVQNAAGEFVKASVQAVTAAAAVAAKSMPKDFRVSITNAPGQGVYPVSSFTWLLLYENPKDKAQAKLFVDFLKWALTDGQKFATDLGYAPLPEEVVKLEMAAFRRSSCRDTHRAEDACRFDSVEIWLSDLHRVLRSALDRHRGGDRRGAVAELGAVDSEVRVQLLGDQDLGPGCRGVRRVALHLGHALLGDSRLGDLSTPVSLGIAVFLSEMRPAGRDSRSSSSPSCSRRFLPSSTVSGAPSSSRPGSARCRCTCRMRESDTVFSGPPSATGCWRPG